MCFGHSLQFSKREQMLLCQEHSRSDHNLSTHYRSRVKRDDDMSRRLFVLSLDAFRVHCRTWCFLPCSPFLFVSSISGWLSAKLYHQLTSYPCPSSCPLYPLFVHYPCMWLSPSISVRLNVLSLGGQDERGQCSFPSVYQVGKEMSHSTMHAFTLTLLLSFSW